MDAEYRPLGHPGDEPRPPMYPTRLRHFIYGCGMVALDDEAKFAGGKQATKVSAAMGGRR